MDKNSEEFKVKYQGILKEIEEDILENIPNNSKRLDLKNYEEVKDLYFKLTNKYKQVLLIEQYYDNPDKTYDNDYYVFNNWIDVEGLDMGWIWARNKEEDNQSVRERLDKYFKERVKEILSFGEDLIVYIREDNEVEIYTSSITVLENEYDEKGKMYGRNNEVNRVDLRVIFSNTEIDF